MLNHFQAGDSPETIIRVRQQFNVNGRRRCDELLSERFVQIVIALKRFTIFGMLPNCFSDLKLGRSCRHIGSRTWDRWDGERCARQGIILLDGNGEG